MRPLAAILLAFCFAPTVAYGQPAPSAAELQSKYLTALAHQGEEEIRAFRARGGKPGAADHPGRKWAARFWEYRAAHPGTPAAAQAVSEALWMWLAAEWWQQMRDAAEALGPGDAAWIDSFRPLLLAADAQKDYRWLQSKLAQLKDACLDTTVCAKAWLYLAHAAARQRHPEQARAAAVQAVRIAPAASKEEFEASFDEITRLSPGLPAPSFTAETLAGQPLSLRDFHGNVVLLNFWASW
jgi:hypothetical protein